MTKDGETFSMELLIRRATIRQLRLHACAFMRLNAPRRTRPELFALVEVAERFADGEVGTAELEAARQRGERLPRKWSADFRLGFGTASVLQDIWDRAASVDHVFAPLTRDYRRALPRHRVFQELLGPAPRPILSPDWCTDTAIALARTMYESRDFSAMPILADALQDAGCDQPAILSHCRDAALTHVRGCWVVDLVLGKS
jgi:hypothetical protein